MLWEQFKELARTEDTAKQSADYRTKLAAGEKATDALRTQLRESHHIATLDAAFKKVSANCTECHKRYRNE
jgi:cytochrome c556